MAIFKIKRTAKNSETYIGCYFQYKASSPKTDLYKIVSINADGTTNLAYSEDRDPAETYIGTLTKSISLETFKEALVKGSYALVPESAVPEQLREVQCQFSILN